MIHRPATHRKTLAMAALAGALMAGVAPWPALGQARQVPETREQVTLSFAPLVRQTAAAVVNVYGARVEKRPQNPFMDDPFFRRFFGDGGFGVPRERVQRSLGSGVVVDAGAGLVVTNNHVIENMSEVKVAFADKREVEATILLRDPRTDLAVLKLADAKNLTAIELADTDELQVGDIVLAMGNPFGVGQTVTQGIVSALARTQIGVGDAQSFIQTDAAINPGNSGGPLFNLEGKVIGINNRLISPVGANIGVGFAIPAEEAMPVIESLKKGVSPERGYLGIGIQPVGADMADALGIDKNKGEFVTRIVKDEAADKAGLKEGDIVLKVNGRDVTPDETLSYIVANVKPGTRIPLDILREGKPMRITATVGTRPSEEKLAQSTFDPDENKDFDQQGENADSKAVRDALGVSVIPLDPEIARQLGMGTDVKGVVVDIPGSGSAAQAGIRRGDVLVSVNYKPVTNTAQLAAAIAEAKTGGRGAILLGVKRRGAPTQYATVRIDD